MAKVSVIVPVYKVEDYLNRCVDSILNQTFEDFELILVDDGSPDNCGAMCDEYAKKDGRIHVIHQENGGLSAARNTGIDSAQGDYLVFVDSDDWLHPQYLESMYGAIMESGALVACCNYKHTPKYSIPIIERAPFVYSMKKPEDVYLNPERTGIQAYAWRYMFRKELLDGIRFPHGKLWEDMFTIPKIIFQVDSIAFIDKELYYYFYRIDSIVNKAWSLKKLDNIDAVEFNLSYFSDSPSNVLKKALCIEYISCIEGNLGQLYRSKESATVKKNVRKKIKPKIKQAIKAYEKFGKLTGELKIKVLFSYCPMLFDVWYELYGVKENISDRIQIAKEKLRGEVK